MRSIYNTAIPFVLTVLLSMASSDVSGQDTWVRDFRKMMEIPSVKTLESSPAHLFVLSEAEGLVVFRAGKDSLQWLYSSEGMEKRGNKLQSDVRFAYLYGDSKNLTIVEPTSVLGVYSSTTLPEKPLSVQRLGDHIYIAMGLHGLGQLVLSSPDDFDKDPVMLFEDILGGRKVLDLASNQSSRMYVLTGTPELLVLDRTDSGDHVELTRSVRLDRTAERLVLTEDELIGAGADGSIFLIDSSGSTETIAEVEESVVKLSLWNDHLVAKTDSGKLWIGEYGRQPELWNEDGKIDFFTVSGGDLWISEDDRIYPVTRRETAVRENSRAEDGSPLEIMTLDNLTIPFPRPVIRPLALRSNHDINDVEFFYESEIENAAIRGQSFYWQPTSSQTGRNEFTIGATTASGETDTVNFSVDVRPFNAPPRFTPLPQITVSVDEEYSLEITAVDPDGMDAGLIRYIGVDLPEGARLNEQTGRFSWTPTIRQVGEFEFQVIATDQFGAAASRDMNIRVIETDPEQEADIDL
ncbi:MAG: Ig domain-containing protein [Balneolaceae bacterium]